MLLRDKFARTECDCRKCQAGCKHKPGMLIPEDLRPIAAKLLDKPVDEVTDMEMIRALVATCEASDGALVVISDKMGRIPTLVPRLKEHGCIFYEDGKCKIHDVAPFGCSHLDLHMDERTGTERSYEAHLQIARAWANTHYRVAWTACKVAGYVSPPLQEKNEKYQEEIRRVEETERCQTGSSEGSSPSPSST